MSIEDIFTEDEKQEIATCVSKTSSLCKKELYNVMDFKLVY